MTLGQWSDDRKIIGSTFNTDVMTVFLNNSWNKNVSREIECERVRECLVCVLLILNISSFDHKYIMN